jgi:hypothetical protein
LHNNQGKSRSGPTDLRMKVANLKLGEGTKVVKAPASCRLAGPAFRRVDTAPAFDRKQHAVVPAVTSLQSFSPTSGLLLDITSSHLNTRFLPPQPLPFAHLQAGHLTTTSARLSYVSLRLPFVPYIAQQHWPSSRSSEVLLPKSDLALVHRLPFQQHLAYHYY